MMTKRLGSRLKSAVALLMLLTAGVFAQSTTVPSQAQAGYHYVGERVYNVTRDAYATIVAIAFDQTYVIQFTSGPLSGQTGQGWRDQDLATLAGCSRELCVGQSAYNTTRDAYVYIVGIEYNGNFVVQFTSGPLSGQTGDGWTLSDLARMYGCYGDVCVGYRVYNLLRNATCTVM